MNLKAKPIINNQYWVVTDGNKKVGNVVADDHGFDVRIGGSSQHFHTTKAIEKNAKIEFEKVAKKKDVSLPFSVFPTSSNRVYNSVLDVKRKLHLFTKTAKSKCYHAAGWFVIKQGNEFVPVFCPKYIFVQRYEYLGPFATETEAKNKINIL